MDEEDLTEEEEDFLSSLEFDGEDFAIYDESDYGIEQD